MTQFYKEITNINNHKKILVIGDVHGNLPQFNTAVEYAQRHDMYIVSLGDLIDYGPNSKEIILATSELVAMGKMLVIQGNHERKASRYYLQEREGNITVKIKPCLQATIDSFGDDELIKDIFLNLRAEMVSIARYKDTFFTHGALDRKVIEDPIYTPYSYQMSLFGEVDRSLPPRADKFPNRVFNWVNKIPENINVFVGHDIRSVVKPVIMGKNNVFFMDTGCSKIDNVTGILGHMSGAVLDNDAKLVRFERFDY